jgi:hypothetical protein
MEKTKYEFNCKSLEESMFLKVRQELTADTQLTPYVLSVFENTYDLLTYCLSMRTQAGLIFILQKSMRQTDKQKFDEEVNQLTQIFNAEVLRTS